MTSPDPAFIASTLDVAVEIFMDGVSTGIATALANFALTIPVEHRDLMTEEIVRSISGDSLVMGQFRGEVRARLLGAPDPSAYDMTTHARPEGGA
jgi:hypothetical protein